MRASKVFSTIQARIIAMFALLFIIAGCLFYFVIGGTVTEFMVEQRIGNQSHDIESFCAGIGRSVNDRDIDTLYSTAAVSYTHLFDGY